MKRGLVKSLLSVVLCTALLLVSYLVDIPDFTVGSVAAAEPEASPSPSPTPRSVQTPVMRINLGGDTVAADDGVEWMGAKPTPGVALVETDFKVELGEAAPPPPVLQKLNRSVWSISAFDHHGSDTADNMIDGDMNTRWASGTAMASSPEQSIEIDMRTRKKFCKIEMDSGASPMDYARGYEVYVSNNTWNWGTPVASGEGKSALVEVAFPEQEARYIKIVQTGSEPSLWWTIREINVYEQIEMPIPTPTPLPTPTITAPVSDDVKDVLKSSVKGQSLKVTIDVPEEAVYRVVLHMAENELEGKRAFDVNIQTNKLDTIVSGDVGEYIKCGPYAVKATGADPKIVIECDATQDNVSLSAVEVYKVTYNATFKDKDGDGNDIVTIDKWYYVPIMELWAKGIINGYTDDTFRPKDNIIGEHVAYMLYNVMRESIAENDAAFDKDKYKTIAELPANFWGYNYIRSYYNYFIKEKMSRKNLETDERYTNEEWLERIKVTREEFAMAVVGARRLDYNEGGKVFVYDPEREPDLCKLNDFIGKGKEEITDNLRYFVELALEKGLLRGDEHGELNPVDFVTRAQAAAFIYNVLNLSENNFVEPIDTDYLPAPRITKEKRPINVGILTLPAIVEGTNEDRNPDFTIMELLDRNINKPMDWRLVNPHPPEFDKSEFAGLVRAPYTNITNINDYSTLEELAKAQTDLNADIFNSGVVGHIENIRKSKFFKYWEVSLNDPVLTPDKIAKDYDILFQTSHGSIKFSDNVKTMVLELLGSGGQMWWENCSGLVIEEGDFTDGITFGYIHPGGAKKYPQVANLDGGKAHPLLDSIYTISQTSSSRINSLGYPDRNSPYYTEMSMIGDGDEWSNDDNRYIRGVKPEDVIVSNLHNTDTGVQLPGCIVRNIDNSADEKPNGRIVVTTTDVGCAISKHINRTNQNKSVEDYKFCYNLFGWMSKVAVNFDDTESSSWEVTEPVVEATVVNYGAKAQIYDLHTIVNEVSVPDPSNPGSNITVNAWNIKPLTPEESDDLFGDKPWILARDSNGYPSQVRLEPNVPLVIEYKFEYNPDVETDKYDFILQAVQKGQKFATSRDSDSDVYSMEYLDIKPVIEDIDTDVNCYQQLPLYPYDIYGSFNVKIPSTCPVVRNLSDVRRIDFEVVLKFEDTVDLDSIVKKNEIVQQSIGTGKPPYEGFNPAGDSVVVDNVAKEVRIKIDKVRFHNPDQYLNFRVPLKELDNNKEYKINATILTTDSDTGERMVSRNTDETVYPQHVYRDVGYEEHKEIDMVDASTVMNELYIDIPIFTDEMVGDSCYIEFWNASMNNLSDAAREAAITNYPTTIDLTSGENNIDLTSISRKELIGKRIPIKITTADLSNTLEDDEGKEYIRLNLKINTSYYGDTHINVKSKSSALSGEAEEKYLIDGVDIT